VLKKPGAVASEYGYFLDQSVDIEAFDSSFYPIPRAELAYLDPQERILLEVARECLDDACEVDWQGQNIGVFIGSYGGDWADLCSRERQAYGPHMLKSMDNFWQSNRISHELDLRGPRQVQYMPSLPLPFLHDVLTSSL
jgi:acyl transferase domain-containing protein